MSGKYFDVPCGKCSRELHWDDDCAEVPGGAIWCACCIDAKTRHDELVSERAAGRREGKELIESALSSLLNLSDEGWIDRRVVKAIEKLKEWHDAK